MNDSMSSQLELSTRRAMNRDTAIDIVRAAGILAIVASHVWSGSWVAPVLFTWHVPVFFFLSGYLWSPKPRTIREEVRRRSASLLKPYAFWFAAVFVVFASVSLLTGRPLTYIAAPIYGGYFAVQPFTTFWFVFVLFMTAVLWRAISSLPVWFRGVVVASGLAAAIVAGPLLAKTPLAIGTALPALVFLAAGQLIRAGERRWPRRALIAACLCAVLALALVILGVSAPLNLKQGDWGTPVVSTFTAIALSWALVVIARATVRFVNDQKASIITGFAMAGFTIVLLHPTVIWIAGDAVPSWIVFVAAVSAPLLIGVAGMRTPLSQWMTGIPPHRPAIHNDVSP